MVKHSRKLSPQQAVEILDKILGVATPPSEPHPARPVHKELPPGTADEVAARLGIELEPEEYQYSPNQADNRGRKWLGEFLGFPYPSLPEERVEWLKWIHILHEVDHARVVEANRQVWQKVREYNRRFVNKHQK